MMRSYNAKIIPIIRSKADRMYIDDIETVSPSAYFTDEQIRQLIREYRKTGKEKLLKSLIFSFSKYVTSIAKNYQEQGLSIGDLMSEGMLGLVVSIQNFDLSNKTKFVTYSNIVISRYMREALDYFNNIVRLPKNIRNNRMKTRELISVMQMNGADDADIAEKIEDGNMIFFTNPDIFGKKSLSDTIGADTSVVIEDLLESKNDEPDRNLNLADLQKDLKNVLTLKLNADEYTVISFYFGLELPYSITSIQDLSNRLSLPKETIKSLKDSAFQKLREGDSLQILSKYI